MIYHLLIYYDYYLFTTTSIIYQLSSIFQLSSVYQLSSIYIYIGVRIDFFRYSEELKSELARKYNYFVPQGSTNNNGDGGCDD